MENFKIGETVIALVNESDYDCQPLKKGEQYIVNDICFCPKSGIQFINVNGKVNKKYLSKERFECIICNNFHESYGLWWTRSIWFCRPSELESLIQESAKEDTVEGYKKAQELLEIKLSLEEINH